MTTLPGPLRESMIFATFAEENSSCITAMPRVLMRKIAAINSAKTARPTFPFRWNRSTKAPVSTAQVEARQRRGTISVQIDAGKTWKTFRIVSPMINPEFEDSPESCKRETARNDAIARPDIPSKPTTIAGHLKETLCQVIAQLIHTATGGQAIIR